MREIKFRAWDGERMIYPEWEKYVIQFDGTIGCFNGKTYDTVEWVLMQFTGLKDKSGREIYEGDIVTAHYFYFNGNFDNDGHIKGKIVITTDGVFIEEKENAGLYVHETTHYTDPCIEVIGTIYDKENP